MQDVASGWTAEDSILVLQAYHVDVVEVQKFSRFLIRLHIILCERPSHPGGIVVALIGVVDRQRQQSGTPVLCRDGCTQIRGKGSDPTMSRKIIADHCDSAGERGLRLQSCACARSPVTEYRARADHFQESV